jgi:hypothetical protein
LLQEDRPQLEHHLVHLDQRVRELHNLEFQRDQARDRERARLRRG